MGATKPFTIAKQEVMDAFKAVKANAGAAGVDEYRRLKGHKTRASLFIEGIVKRQPWLFVHWQRGMVGGFA